jgi:formate dehydrogenase subunit gamma
MIGRRVARFDGTERVVHWCNAVLFAVLVATGAALKVGPLSTLVANRHAMKTLHVYAGFALPLPLVLACVIPAGRRFRDDLRRLNRWSRDDRRWWSASHRAQARLGKFNPGQKLNAAFVGASIVVMFATGLMLWRPDPFSDDLRTGATFVHDSTWLALCIVIAGHIWFALRDPDALRAITLGWVTEAWARRERPRWWAEVAAGASGSAGAIGDVDAGAQQRVDERRVRAREVTVGDGEDPRAGDRLGGLEL